MIKNRYITIICIAVLIVALIFTCVFTYIGMNRDGGGVSMEYEYTIFDDSYVHTLNIEVDEGDWNEMLENAMAEEYISCNVTIDGETLYNVGIRPKGNTSLSSVASMDSDRYSFKIEFDHYDSSINYDGLDKISLNNIIQDNTYMKDYLSYTMMREMGVAAAPLCSYVYISVNGEEWGLYLGVEAVEESFAQRNYGNDYGKIYKPDSMSMGGGDRDREDFGGGDMPQPPENMEGGAEQGFGGMPPENMPNDQAPQTGEDNAADGAQAQQNGGQTGTNSNENSAQPGSSSGDAANIQAPHSETQTEGAPDSGSAQDQSSENPTTEGQQSGEAAAGAEGSNEGQGFERERGGMGGGPGGMGGNDVALIYTDDEIDSYSNIFDNAVFDVSDSDKNRLISSIKQLNSGENLEEVVNIDQVLRYFVVHNFVDNFDSYTGSMMHNYYLYEKDGVMSMIPWDYNLAFGAFSMGGGRGGFGGESSGTTTDNATYNVNYPIDTPVSGTTLEDRPMLGKLLENEEYINLYHQLMDEFISNYFENGRFETEMERVKELISPYVEKDPTKFCTYDEFLTGIDTLETFCLLRAESVRGQLNGTIPSTEEEQSVDPSNLVDASYINIDDMGSQNFGGGPGGGRGGFGGEMQAEASQTTNENTSSETAQTEQTGTENAAAVDGVAPSNDSAPQDGALGQEIPADGAAGQGQTPTNGEVSNAENFDGISQSGEETAAGNPGSVLTQVNPAEGAEAPAAPANKAETEAPAAEGAENAQAQGGFPGGAGNMGGENNRQPNFGGFGGQTTENNTEKYIYLGASLIVLALGIVIAKLFR